MSLAGFHPTIQRWFSERLGEPTAPQRAGWPLIQEKEHTLIAAPTGSGKTLAAFLSALDSLLSQGSALADETSVLYVSPLKALGNDVQKNLSAPLAELQELDPGFPEVRVLVRSGDTPQKDRAAMVRKPPHVLVTTPESLYILLTSASGRAMLSTVRTTIVDEIHAVLPDRRGAHLALSLERLAALAGEFQRIGLSATQKPLDVVGRFLGGAGREVALVDEGHLRAMELEIEIPPSPLEAVCSAETWGEIYRRIVELVQAQRTTLVFVQTRKLAERVSAELAKLLGPDQVACHHSSLSKERRLDAEQRLKAGALKALVATASLELGIDVGEVDLAIQIGAPRSIAALLQRIGRSGHGVGRLPRGRLFPLTQDELVESAALVRAVRRGVLDRTPEVKAPLDVLAQQIVAECAAGVRSASELFESFRRAGPYTGLERADFDALVALHSRGRRALLHAEGIGDRLRGTRRSRHVAITCGGAIPDSTQYRVVVDPEGSFVGHVDEDFAIESSIGDVFQLGNTSWRVLKIERGTLRVADARGVPPSLPFWFGEAPSRTMELSLEVSAVREHAHDAAWGEHECGLSPPAALELARYLAEARSALGAMPTLDRLVLERFFDESGGTQLVLHSAFGNRINRAYGLALRKRFCRRFGFELQAAANEDAIVISLSPQHSFPLDEVFDYLRASSVRELLIQAVLVTPLFQTRWRWNAVRSLLLERFQSWQKVAAPLLRMRAEDLLAGAFPAAIACPETLATPELEIPWDHPIVAQTLRDCIEEAMDVDGLIALLGRLASDDPAQRIERIAVETAAPSPLARSILSARPYGFLDDAPLEERRTQAVLSRRILDPHTADELGELDSQAIERVRADAWPDPRDAEELHEALSWMGYVTRAEAEPWTAWLAELERAGRAVEEDGRWFATGATREPKELVRGRLEVLGPVHAGDERIRELEPAVFELEREGAVLRTRFAGKDGWCERRLLARIQRASVERLRREIEPVSAVEYLRFLAAWQHVDEEHQVEGPAGLRAVIAKLAGFEAPVAVWEKKLLAARVRDYRPEWLDQLALGGEIGWGRLFGSARAALRSTPIAFFPRAERADWLALAAPIPTEDALSPTWPARAILEALSSAGALFGDDLARATKLLPSDLERGLEELVALGRVTGDSFASLRGLLRRARRAPSPPPSAGRWSLFRSSTPAGASAPDGRVSRATVEFLARALLRRYGIVFRAVLERERTNVPWRDLARTLRLFELAGEVRGGRFVAGFSGEQFALGEAVTLARAVRKRESSAPVTVSPADPLNLRRALFPEGSSARVEEPARSTRLVTLP